MNVPDILSELWSAAGLPKPSGLLFIARARNTILAGRAEVTR